MTSINLPYLPFLQSRMQVHRILGKQCMEDRDNIFKVLWSNENPFDPKFEYINYPNASAVGTNENSSSK
ncbi:hypothetical protein CARUB_v10027491mg [Capsella rubella]|uniref:Uncharacterized protein n=1 Tax=Capsella rubella TaxID=81985 RepID=R0G7X9_9BRAS|nr:hypothetical protein CARUB_v10027491mg [Capsella rubella]